MPCQICGRFSSFYPLCNKHFRMKDQDLVNKCENCGLWFEGKKELCTLCSKGVKRGKDLIHVAKSVFEKWANSLYAIGKAGCKYCQNDHDLSRYNRTLDIASNFYEILKDIPNDDSLGFSKDRFQEWSDQLYDISKMGLKYGDISYDIERFNDILEIQEEIMSSLEAVTDSITSSMERITEKKEKNKIIDQEFITDRSIPKRIVEMIKRAEKEILIASPWIWESQEVIKSLEEVVEQKRIRVRILTRPAKGKRDELHKEQIRTFHKMGFQIELEEKLHAKLILVDDTEILLGSANLVGTSLNRNYEASLWTNHQMTVQKAKFYFTELMGEIFESKLSKK